MNTYHPFLGILALCSILHPVALSPCKKNDFMYVYTECQNNARWRVQVPNATCEGEGLSVEFPTPGQKCDVKCGSGTYLDVNQNKCSKCQPGTYSLGSGVRFDMWNAMPEGFAASADKVDPSEGGSCSRAQWRPMGDYLAGQSDLNCQLSLTYTVNLASNGEVVFYYRFRSEYSFFTFDVQNGLCESVGRDENANPMMDETDQNEVKMHRVSLKMGINVLHWQVLPVSDRMPSSSGNSSGGGLGDYPVAIHSIQVFGIPYVYNCQTCHPGFSSEAGASKCVKCRADTYSTSGEACRPCPDGQFAPAGSAGCTPRPVCQPSDYQLAYAKPCSAAAGSFQLAPAYQWVLPHICSGGASLPSVPPADSQKSCRDYCNPGMAAAQTTTGSAALSCVPCSENQFSFDNAGKCTQCPSKTQVVYEYVARNWAVIPPLMNLSCIILREDGSSACNETGWYLMGDRVQTSATRQLHSLIMTLDIPGFHATPDPIDGGSSAVGGSGAGGGGSSEASDNPDDKASGVHEIGALTVDFQVDCITTCRLFLLKFESVRHVTVKSWTGNQQRKQFKYTIRRNNRHKFYLVFEPASFDDTDTSAKSAARASSKQDKDWAGNRLTVYSVRVTNALNSGGVRCQPCPLGLDKNKCIPCPAGKYYDVGNATCSACPPGTIVAKRPAEGIASCAPCSVGMRAVGGVSCDMDANPMRAHGGGGTTAPSTEDDAGVGHQEFDFTRLLDGDFWLASGTKQFTGRGSQYQHLYNVSLSSRSKARCVSNSSKVSESIAIESFVCRVTVVPNNRNPGLTFAALPTSFGDRLLNASSSEQSPGAETMMRASGWDKDPDGMDTHVFFESDVTTQACQQRRLTLLTLRCDPKSVQPKLSLPPRCPDGTCDGCNFHLMLETRQACQLCRTRDYERVNGECVLGKQTVHLFPPKRCYLADGEPQKKILVVDCPLVSKPVGIIMIVIAFVGLTSFMVACHCYRKNRTLQYKYMQLVESKEGELPGVESCAVHEGEEGEDDEAEVSVKGGGSGGGRGSSAVLSKLRRSILPSGGGGGRRSGRGGGGVEHLNLTEQMDDLSL